MLTFANHLVGVTADRPHPQSYRPDFPLDPSLADEEARIAAAHAEGLEEGTTEAEFNAEIAAEAEESAHTAVVRELQGRLRDAAEEVAGVRSDLSDAEDDLATLRQQLAQKSA